MALLRVCALQSTAYAQVSGGISASSALLPCTSMDSQVSGRKRISRVLHVPRGMYPICVWDDAVTRDIAGGTTAWRNMDEENDARKVTVKKRVIPAVEPTVEDLQRYVHVIGPGFLGTASGFNEQGRYLMQSSGCNPLGPAAK